MNSKARLRRAVPPQSGVIHPREVVIRAQPAKGEDPRRGRYDPFAHSAAMRIVKGTIDHVASTDATVLISGESGVGKEFVARAVHHQSPRHRHPFIKVNCAALPMDLLESELFGYERGAFTGAHRRKPGKFELANKGTIFLDEIGEMPLPLQAKLLHVLQDREFSRLGSRQDVRVDVRVIAATNRDLAILVDCGTFRDDLYYRLNVVNIYIPLLRDRREEIPVLVDHFLDRYAQQYQRPRQASRRPSMETLPRLCLAREYPGAREHRQAHRPPGDRGWLDRELSAAQHKASPLPHLPAPVVALPAMVPAAPAGGQSLKAIGRAAALQAERGTLKQVLDHVHWNRREAARLLKVSYRTLRRKIEQCGLVN